MNYFFTNHPEILDHLHDAVISTNLDGKITDCNSAAERIYEYSRAELVGNSVAILYPEDQFSRMQELLAKVSNEGRADGEFMNLTKGGRAIWIHLSVSLLKNDEGVPYGMIGFSINITAQREAAEARQKAEELNRAARAAAGVGTWYWDIRTGELAWDQQSNLLLDVEPGAPQGYEVFVSAIHPDDRARVADLLQHCLKSESEYAAEYRVLQRDGSVRWIYAKGQIHRDASNSPTQMLGVATDITARRRAEEDLHESQAKYRVLFESPHIGVACGNVDRFTDANDAYCKMVGYSREQLLSGAVRWQDFTPPEYLELDYVHLQSLASTGVAAPYEKDYIRSDGSRIRVLIGAALLSRDPLQWSCFILDMTQQHRALSALRQGEQLASAAKLGSALAHEINNPLTSLTNVIYLLRFGTKDLPREELLVSAQESLDRVTRITRQMIGIWSAADTVSEFKIDEVLEDTMAAYSSRARSKNLRIRKRNELSDRTMTGVEADFRRLISSLVENAVENTHPGGTVQVRVRAAHEWSKDRTGISIVVVDNGPGIAKQQLPQLFEPFVSTKNSKGSGLGLWASRGLAEKHGGNVRVRTSTRAGASGTCVSVFLPQHSVQRGIEV